MRHFCKIFKHCVYLYKKGILFRGGFTGAISQKPGQIPRDNKYGKGKKIQTLVFKKKNAFKPLENVWSRVQSRITMT